MHPSTKQYIDFLQEEATAWEEAANNAETSIRKYLHNPENRKEWEGWVTDYRNKAQRCREIIKTLSEDQNVKL